MGPFAMNCTLRNEVSGYSSMHLLDPRQKPEYPVKTQTADGRDQPELRADSLPPLIVTTEFRQVSPDGSKSLDWILQEVSRPYN